MGGDLRLFLGVCGADVLSKYEVILVCLGFLHGLDFLGFGKPDWVEDLLFVNDLGWDGNDLGWDGNDLGWDGKGGRSGGVDFWFSSWKGRKGFCAIDVVLD